jgi:hypothetical protein
MISPDKVGKEKGVVLMRGSITEDKSHAIGGCLDERVSYRSVTGVEGKESTKKIS